MIELGLQRISRLLYDTPLPWRAIHVAGTNGKGSVCSYISEMLNVYNQSGYRKRKGHQPIRHGRFTSPHLMDRWDCIQLSNEERIEAISPEVFLEVEKAVQARNQKEVIKASEFELLTATAFEAFTRAELDIGVVEVGMGGRLDATNVIGQPIFGPDGQARKDVDMEHFRPLPVMTAITRIGLDHQQFLGDTYAKIASEKAGILKPAVPLTYYQEQDVSEVVEVIRQKAKELGAPIIPPNQLQMPNVQDLTLPDGWRKHNGEIAITCTWAALTKLGRLPERLPAWSSRDHQDLIELCTSMKAVIKDYVFPGRQEWLCLAPLTGLSGEILLDGAHNQQGIDLLAKSVRELRGTNRPNRIIYVTAISNSQDRRPEDIMRPLLAPRDSFFAVEFGPVAGMPWVEPRSSKETVDVAKSLVPDLSVAKAYGNDISGALKAACSIAEEQSGSHVVVCGSLYLAGEVHRLLRDLKS